MRIKEINPARPLDRGHLLTEQRLDASSQLDTLSVTETLTLINDQDATVAAAVRKAIPSIAELIESVVAAIQTNGRLIYVGAGTSGRLGVLDASECPPTFHCDPDQVIGVIAGGDGALRQSSEGKEDEPEGARQELDRLGVGRGDVVVGIAAGGATPYVWGALGYAKIQCNATTGIVSCVPIEDVAADLEIDHVVEVIVGPEVVTGSTRMKAGTATKMALNMISTTVMTQLGKTWGNLMVDLRATNDKLRDRATRILIQQCDLTRDQATDLLDRARGRVKLALAMGQLGVGAVEADHLLNACGGDLRSLIGDPK